jgi:hypothetical protein
MGPSNVVTTGGITYAEYQWGMGGCMEIEGIGPVIRNSNDFSIDFDLAMETGVVCPDIFYTESATIVLGALSPGSYTLTTTSWGAPVGTNTFTVPTNSGPMLQPIGFAGNGTFQMQLNGVPYVSYVLQSSTDLMNWNSLSTNFVGQPLTDPSAVLSGWRFYRIQIPNVVNLSQ